jgi:nitrogen regulatory protein P-II 2
MGQSMKLVCAIIKPFKLDVILEALTCLEIRSLTVTETKGYGQTGITEFYRGAKFIPNFLPMTKIEVAVAGDQVADVIQAILRVARTGRPGDGKIFVSELDQVLSIHSGVTADITAPPLAA